MTPSYRVTDPGGRRHARGRGCQRQVCFAFSEEAFLLPILSKSGCASCVQRAWATTLVCDGDCGLDIRAFCFAAVAKAYPSC